jgi:hypothetical protein
MSDNDRQTQDAVQYLRALLLIVDPKKIESRVIRRMPTHWMARPTFESINWDLVRMNEFSLEQGRKRSGR